VDYKEIGMIYGDWIGRWGVASPNHEALVDTIEGRRYTYAELSAEVNRMGHFLADGLGIVKGDRVACLSLNRAAYVTLFLALSRLGAILVPLNFRLAKGEFVYFLEDAAPTAIFFDRKHREIVQALKSEVQLPHYVCLDEDPSVGVCLPAVWDAHGAHSLPEVDIRADDPQLIIYTSGTTGLPKGVILTHGMLTWNAVNTHAGWDLRASDRTILHSALFYTAGWNVFTLPLFQCRGTNILVRGFEADLILDLIEREKVTVFFGVPTMFRMLMDSPRFGAADFSSIRFMVSGGAPLGRTIFDAFLAEKQIHICEGYGLTEVGPNDFMANGKLGTIGHPMPFVDVKLVSPGGAEVPVGEDGEILIRGPNVCAGYWNRPEATAEAIVDGWFHTGDLGRLDGDGHMAIVGRIKDMFISGGINVYPAEIERVIEQHPSVAGAAVIGVPDPKWGEVGKAVVELKPGAALTMDELQGFMGDRLGKFKRPKYMTFIDSLPRTPASGKIRKFILKERHGNPNNG
jgi:fatty-acyl-CoA synthase